jgi:hypothetical protein
MDIGQIGDCLELGVESFCLQALEEFGVCTLCLLVAPGVSDRGEVDLDADRCAVILEQPAGELATVISDDAVRHIEMAHQPTDELDSRPGWNCAHRFHLCPLGELVDCDVEVAIALLRSREWT